MPISVSLGRQLVSRWARNPSLVPLPKTVALAAVLSINHALLVGCSLVLGASGALAQKTTTNAPQPEQVLRAACQYLAEAHSFRSNTMRLVDSGDSDKEKGPVYGAPH